MCRKNYPEQEILINIAILLGIPIKWQCLSLSFYGNYIYKNYKGFTRKLPNFLFRISFGTFFWQFEKCILLSEKKQPLVLPGTVRDSK